MKGERLTTNLELEQKSMNKMREFIKRGFKIVEDTVYSTEEHEHKICPCCEEELGKNIQVRIKFDDTGEEALLHRYHSMNPDSETS